MFKKILVAINNSEVGKQVFEEALHIAKSHNASLMLVHVISPIEDMYAPLEIASLTDGFSQPHAELIQSYMSNLEDFEKEGINFLQLYTELATKAGVLTEFSQHLGNPGRTICNIARTWEADLIVMGRRGLSGLSELILGSVSNYVLHRAHCSVLTIHQDQVLSSATEVVHD